MKDLLIDYYIIKGFEFFADGGEMFCYRCGAQLSFEDENCETDRFGRTFCSDGCRKSYYGGEYK